MLGPSWTSQSSILAVMCHCPISAKSHQNRGSRKIKKDEGWRVFDEVSGKTKDVASKPKNKARPNQAQLRVRSTKSQALLNYENALWVLFLLYRYFSNVKTKKAPWFMLASLNVRGQRGGSLIINCKMKGISPQPQRHPKKKVISSPFAKKHSTYSPFFPVGMSGSWGYAKTERAHGPPFLLPRVSEHRALGSSDPALFMRPVLCSLCLILRPCPSSSVLAPSHKAGHKKQDFRVNQTTEPTFLCTTP